MREISRRRALRLFAVGVGSSATVGSGTAAYVTSDSTSGSSDQGTLDLKLQGTDADRIPADGDLVLASGGSYLKRTRLTNGGSIDVESVDLDVTTVTTDEGTTESGESNTSPGDGGELDDELQLKASLERNGTSVGYFFGNASSFASYATAVAGPEQTIGLSSPLDSTPTDIVLELFYPSGSTAALGDRLVFDLDVALTSGVSSTGWRDVDAMRVALQAGGEQAADPVVTTLTQQEYSSVTMDQAFSRRDASGGRVAA